MGVRGQTWSDAGDDDHACSPVLWIRPTLRDSDIERIRHLAANNATTVYWSLDGRYLSSAPAPTLRGGNWWYGLRQSLDPAFRVLVLPEPLWIRYWPAAVGTALGARFLRFALRRPRLVVASYAIDNLEPAERLTHPRLDRWPSLNRVFGRALTGLVRASVRLTVDRMVFGTLDAYTNYESSAILPTRRHALSACVVPEFDGVCSSCYPEGVIDGAPREREVVFLGELSVRKGVDVLLSAWEKSVLRTQGWRLTICGSGDLESDVTAAVNADPTIQHRHPGRDEVHALLRRAYAVVLPSQRVPRWREQVGLSLLEGESHGCRLIVSAESGAALELSERAGARVVAPGDVYALAEALNHLPEQSPAAPRETGHGDALVRALSR